MYSSESALFETTLRKHSNTSLWIIFTFGLILSYIKLTHVYS